MMFRAIPSDGHPHWPDDEQLGSNPPGRETAIPLQWTAKLPGSLHLGIHGHRLERFFPDYGVTRAAPGRVTPLVEFDSTVPGIPAATFN